MSRYIDADALIETLKTNLIGLQCNEEEFPRTWGFTLGIKEAIKNVHLSPTADVVEVRHGYWEYLWFDAVCSECGYINRADAATRCRTDPPYCPKCGAKMDGAKCKNSEREGEK